MAWNGATINLKEHETLHAQWINEHHSFGHFDLTVLNASPDRVRARGTVDWQAEFVNPNPIPVAWCRHGTPRISRRRKFE